MAKNFTRLLLLMACSIGGWLSAQVSTFPQFENFETQAQGPTTCNPAFTFVGSIWRNGDDALPASPGHSLDWTADIGGTSSGGTGPSVDHTLGSGTGKYIYTEASCTAVREAHLVSDYLDLTNLSGLTIDFWYHMFGATPQTMHLDVDTTGGTGAWLLNVTPAWSDNIDLWQNKVVNLSQFVGMDSVRIRFRSLTGASTFTHDYALDDILLYEPQPYDFGVLSASSPTSGCGLGNETVTFDFFQLGFDSLAAGDTISVGYSINGGTAVMEDLILGSTVNSGDTVTYSFINQANLSTPGTYNFQVWVSYSQDAGSGNDTLTFSVTNIPILSTYPEIVEDFEGGQNGWLAGGTSSFAFGTPAKAIIQGAASGSNAWVTGGLGTGLYNANEDGWIESPCFDLSQYCNPYLRMNVWWNTEFSWDGSNVQYSTDGGTTWNLIGLNGDPYNWYNDNTINGTPGGSQLGWTGRNSSSNGSGGWVMANHALQGLSNAPGVIFRVNFGSDGSVQDEGFAFDDFMVYDKVNLGNDVTACNGGPAVITSYNTEGESILWNTGDTTATINVTTTGWYSVTVSSDTACVGSDSIYVVVMDSLFDPFVATADTVCGNSYLLEAAYVPNSVYLWSTGDTTNTVGNPSGNGVVVPASGVYTVGMSTVCGDYIDSIDLMLLGAPIVNLGNDTAYCGSGMLDAGNAGLDAMWSTGDTTQMISVSTTGTYSVDVTDGNGCVGSDDINVIVNAIPTPSLGADTFYCDGSAVMVGVSVVDSNCVYSWNTGATGSSISVNAVGDYVVTCTDLNGCAGEDSVSVSMVSAPTSTFNFTISGAGLTYDFTTTSTGTSYFWDFGDGNTSTTQNPSHTYTVDGSYTVTLTVSNECGTDSSSQGVSVVAVAEGFGQGMNVFPNPNNGTFHVVFESIDAQHVKLEVVSLVGQVIYAEELSSVSAGMDHTVSLENVAKGYYFVRLTAGENTAVKRISVK